MDENKSPAGDISGTDEHVAVHGRTRKAIQEAIRICKDEDVLRE